MMRDKPAGLSVQEKQYQGQRAQEQELQRLISQFFVLDKNTQHQQTSSVTPALVKGENIIKLCQRQHENILKDLKRATAPERLIEDVKVFEKLTETLDETAYLTDQVAQHKIFFKNIDNERRLVNKRVLVLRSQQVTDRQCQQRLWDAMKTVEALENRLETQMIHFGTIVMKNRRLREEISALMAERTIFLVQWDSLTRKLSDGKKVMLDLIEQATIAYNQREDWCSKLQILRMKAFHEMNQNSVAIREHHRRMDDSSKLKEFLELKGQKRVMGMLQVKEREKRQVAATNLQQKLEVYKTSLKDIETFTNEKSVKKIALKFASQEHTNLTNFNYVIEVIEQLEEMNDRLGYLHLDIDERYALNESRKNQQTNGIEQLEATLHEVRAETQQSKEDLNETQSLLDDLLRGVSTLFAICRCKGDPLIQLLGDNTKVAFYNVHLYMHILEAEVHRILINAGYRDATKKSSIAADLLGSDKEIPEIYPIDKIIKATPCSICVEHEVVSDVIDTLQVAWSRTEAQKVLAQRLEIPGATNKIHTTSHCTLPKARYLMQKRYE